MNTVRTMLGLAQTAPSGIDQPLPAAASGYGVQLFQSVVALAAVCFAAWWVLRWASRQGLGKGPQGRHIKVLERVVLDPRRSLFLVEIGSRVMLLGTGEQSLSVLAEIQPGELTDEASHDIAAARATGPRGFASVLARLRSGTPASAPAAPAAEVASRVE